MVKVRLFPWGAQKASHILVKTPKLFNKKVLVDTGYVLGHIRFLNVLPMSIQKLPSNTHLKVI